MDQKLVARELILTAKSLLADKSDYKYDPDHKHKPQGGGQTPERCLKSKNKSQKVSGTFS